MPQRAGNIARRFRTALFRGNRLSAVQKAFPMPAMPHAPTESSPPDRAPLRSTVPGDAHRGKRIAIVAIGTRGDVQPFLALGDGLRRAGHSVCLITHDLYAEPAAALDLALAPLSGDIRAMVADATAGVASRLRRNPVAKYLHNRRNSRAMAALWIGECLEACRDAEAIIATGAGFFIGAPVAERLGLPLIQAYTQPVTPTRAFPSPFLGQNSWRAPGIVNLLRHHVLRQLSWQSLRPAINAARRDRLGLPGWPLRGPWARLERRGAPVLYGYSPQVLPRPDDWPAQHKLAGYWFLDRAQTWQPPPALEEFLAARPGVIHVGFGSVILPDRRRMCEMIVAALRRTGRRAVLVAGWSGFEPADLPDNILAIDEVPYAWLLPRIAATIHHGGGGTASAGLRAGVPSITIPFLSDQHFWGTRLHELGVAAPPIPYRRLTVGRLAEAIEHVTGNDTMARKAADLAAAIRAEDGVSHAVAQIGQLLASGRAAAIAA
jgi:UDP:flavonoid glycosyltransferase YjiC (YdhE family)